MTVPKIPGNFKSFPEYLSRQMKVLLRPGSRNRPARTSPDKTSLGNAPESRFKFCLEYQSQKNESSSGTGEPGPASPRLLPPESPKIPDSQDQPSQDFSHQNPPKFQIPGTHWYSSSSVFSNDANFIIVYGIWRIHSGTRPL